MKAFECKTTKSHADKLDTLGSDGPGRDWARKLSKCNGRTDIQTDKTEIEFDGTVDMVSEYG